MSTVDGFGRRWGRNGKFRVTVGPAIGGVLAGLLYASLIGFNCRRFKNQMGDFPNDGLHDLCVILVTALFARGSLALH